MRPEILFPIFTSTSILKGVGPKLKTGLDNLCGNNIVNVLQHIPSDVIIKTKANIATSLQGDNATP